MSSFPLTFTPWFFKMVKTTTTSWPVVVFFHWIFHWNIAMMKTGWAHWAQFKVWLGWMGNPQNGQVLACPGLHSAFHFEAWGDAGWEYPLDFSTEFSFFAVFQGFEDILLVVKQVILTRQKGEVYRGSMKKPVLATLEDHWGLKSSDGFLDP